MWLESAKPSHARSQRLERWSLNLWTFEFQGVHCLGIHNVHADTLSRFPLSLVVVEVPLSTSQISQAQCEDPILSTVIQRLGTSNDKSTPSDKWNKFSLHWYKQIWAQLILHKIVLCCKVKSPTMQEEKFLIVVLRSLQQQFLAVAHDKAGHQSIDCTLVQLSEIAYWVNISKYMTHYCSYCTNCQLTKSLSSQPAFFTLYLPPYDMGVGGSRHSKSTNVTSGKPLHLSSPRLFLKVAVCTGNAWSESIEDSQDFMWSSVYTSRTPRKIALWPR